VTTESQRNKGAPLRIGLTGGIASGKTVVANMFAELGATIIDTDVIARNVVEPGKPALEQVRQTFGDQVLTEDGGLDRSRLRGIVFSDDAKRAQLEQILHPVIQEETVRQAETAGGAYQIVVVPLLLNSPLRGLANRILVVDCDEATQIDRLVARDIETEVQARRILAAQASREERLAAADDIIKNDQDLEHTRQQVQRLHKVYLQLSQSGDSSGT
jgi:dephospho-CoA kinase